MSDTTPPSDFRAGFVSFVGRPNVGKSTLTNALVGEKVAITSSKPQTTRRAIRGVVHREHGQLIVVDTPGIHRPRTLLGQRLNDLVQSTLSDVDVIGFCIPANEKLGPGDRFINESLDGFPRAKKVAIVTKTDTASRTTIAEQLLAISELRDWDAVIPLSAVTDDQLDILVTEVTKLMPLSERLYPAEATTDETVVDRVSELIREAALEGVQDLVREPTCSTSTPTCSWSGTARRPSSSARAARACATSALAPGPASNRSWDHGCSSRSA
jgi:GTP-binding protein Era